MGRAPRKCPRGARSIVIFLVFLTVSGAVDTSLVGVLRARDVDHAVELANDCEYGLSAAVFSRDINTALSVAQRIDSGICHINSPTVQDEAQMHFGGTKASGVGRFGGKAGVAEFTDLRWISISTKHRHYPI